MAKRTNGFIGITKVEIVISPLSIKKLTV